MHPGSSRTECMTRQHFTWSTLRRDVDSYVNKCRACQLAKSRTHKHGKLPLKTVPEDERKPWYTVCVDCVGPHKLTLRSGKTVRKLKLMAMTAIDPATGFFKIIKLQDQTAESTALALDEMWLTQFPRPVRCVHDNGTEFTGGQFQDMLKSHGTKDVPTTTRNPQANAILERSHGVLLNCIRAHRIAHPEVLQNDDPFPRILNTAQWAMNSTYHTVTQATAGQLAFGRDMIMPTKFAIDWPAIYAPERDTQRAHH